MIRCRGPWAPCRLKLTAPPEHAGRFLVEWWRNVETGEQRISSTEDSDQAPLIDPFDAMVLVVDALREGRVPPFMFEFEPVPKALN